MPPQNDATNPFDSSVPHRPPQVLATSDFGVANILLCAPIIENPKDGTLLALIPEGEFLAGDEKFPVLLPGYYLAMTCVTNAQYARFLSETRPEQSERDKWILFSNDCFVRQGGDRYEAYGGKEAHPVVQVSWFGAEAYCDWSGLRLPSELEWEKGSRGVDGREYPWGATWDESKCRNSKTKGSETTCSIWDYAGGNSPWGLYQMSGNVWEWCADWYEGDAYKRYKEGKLTPPGSGASRVLRGGSWLSDDTDGFRCAYRYCLKPVNRFNFGGFRCARTL